MMNMAATVADIFFVSLLTGMAPLPIFVFALLTKYVTTVVTSRFKEWIKVS
jgi:hypothetical protein